MKFCAYPLRDIVLHGFHTLPLIIVLALYLRIFCIANQITARQNNSILNNNKAAR